MEKRYREALRWAEKQIDIVTHDMHKAGKRNDSTMVQELITAHKNLVTVKECLEKVMSSDD